MEDTGDKTGRGGEDGTERQGMSPSLTAISRRAVWRRDAFCAALLFEKKCFVIQNFHPHGGGGDGG